MERFRRLGVHPDAHENGAWCVAASAKASNCDFATGGADGVVKLWSLKSGTETAAAAIGDSNGDTNGEVAGDALHKKNSRSSLSPVEPVASLKHHGLGVVGVAIASEGTTGASTSLDGTLKLWDIEKPDAEARKVSGMNENITEIWALAISADGSRVVTAGVGGSIQVVDSGMTPMMENSFNYDPDVASGDAPMCMSLALSPDETRLAVGAQDGSVRIFDVETGKPVTSKMEGHSGPVRSISFIPGESSLVTCADDGLINFYDVDAAHLADKLRGHAGMVMAARPSPCGKYICSGSSDRKLKVWDRKLKEAIFTLGDHTDSVWGTAYVADGKRIVSVSDDQSLYVLDSEHADIVVA